MKYSIAYSSRTGNTKWLAEGLRKILPSAECVYFGELTPEALAADRVYLGFWTDKGSCDEKTAEFIKKLGQQEVFLFGTAGFGGSTEYFQEILNKVKLLLPAGSKYLGGWMCQGKMPITVRQRYEALSKSPKAPANVSMLIENFDRALSHPNLNDLEELKEVIKKCTNK